MPSLLIFAFNKLANESIPSLLIPFITISTLPLTLLFDLLDISNNLESIPFKQINACSSKLNFVSSLFGVFDGFNGFNCDITLFKLLISSFNEFVKFENLLFIMLVMPDEINLTDNELNNVTITRKYLDYIYKTENLVRPYYSK